MSGQNADRYCTALAKGDETPSGRAALLMETAWDVGEQILVKFLEGDPALQMRVRAVAERWTGPDMANITFYWVADGPADIRITFEQGVGSWSSFGTRCRDVVGDHPTMNFGWLTADSSDQDVHSVVLHEFGHSLGLGHEHQNAASGIRWNEPAVFAALTAPPHNWDEVTIRQNVFDMQDVVTASSMDPDSIMMYPIPAAWTLDGTSVDLNADLSDGDVATVRQIYRT